VAPANPYHLRNVTPPARNVERARALLRETGLPTPVVVNLMVVNTPLSRQEGEVIQSMAREVGFDVRVQATGLGTSLQAAQRGGFEPYLIGWGGRVDPEGTLSPLIVTNAPFTDGHYSNADVDRLMNQARQVTNPAERIQVYEQAVAIMGRERPI